MQPTSWWCIEFDETRSRWNFISPQKIDLHPLCRLSWISCVKVFHPRSKFPSVNLVRLKGVLVFEKARYFHTVCPSKNCKCQFLTWKYENLNFFPRKNQNEFSCPVVVTFWWHNNQSFPSGNAIQYQESDFQITLLEWRLVWTSSTLSTHHDSSWPPMVATACCLVFDQFSGYFGIVVIVWTRSTTDKFSLKASTSFGKKHIRIFGKYCSNDCHQSFHNLFIFF